MLIVYLQSSLNEARFLVSEVWRNSFQPSYFYNSTYLCVSYDSTYYNMHFFFWQYTFFYKYGTGLGGDHAPRAPPEAVLVIDSVNYWLRSKSRIGVKYQPTDFCFYMCRMHEFHVRSSRLCSDGKHVHGQRVSVRVQDIRYVFIALNNVLKT
jgi:hypothetical protein